MLTVLLLMNNDNNSTGKGWPPPGADRPCVVRTGLPTPLDAGLLVPCFLACLLLAWIFAHELCHCLCLSFKVGPWMPTCSSYHPATSRYLCGAWSPVTCSTLCSKGPEVRILAFALTTGSDGTCLGNGSRVSSSSHSWPLAGSWPQGIFQCLSAKCMKR